MVAEKAQVGRPDSLDPETHLEKKTENAAKIVRLLRDVDGA